MAISGNQIRAARALIGIEQKDLSAKAGVAIGTIRNMEAAGANPVGGRTDTLNAVVDALKALDVIFVPANGEGPGVRLRKRVVMNRELLDLLIERVKRHHIDRLSSDAGISLQLKPHDSGYDLMAGTTQVGELVLTDNALEFTPARSGQPLRADGHPTEAEIASWILEAVRQSVR